MELFQAIILGIVQGLTEPLPISSSGHLILTPWLLNWREHSLAFDVALHGGTALAIIIYFWADWMNLARAFFAGIRERDFTSDHQRRLVWYIALASIPGVAGGLLLEDTIEHSLRQPWLVAILLVGMGAFMLAADRMSHRRRAISDVRLSDALIVGFAQTLALFPGVSRSGVTITAALFLQMSRPDAARFSFLLSGPIVTGAFVYSMGKLIINGFPAGEWPLFATGIAVAAVVGYFAIRFLLVYLQRSTLRAFAYYRFALGGLILGLFFLRG